MKTAFGASLFFALFAPVLFASAQTIPSIDAYLENANDTGLQKSLPPSPVDLLFDADSYVPPFYRGRALPSPGTIMHFQALAHFGVADSAITYTWRRNGRVEGDVSGVGKSSVSLPAPTLFGTDTISVDARAADVSAYGSASVTISSIDPSVTLYQDHPLFGIEYYNALTDQTSIPDLEMTFASVPYFAHVQSPDDAGLMYAWSVDGVPVAAATTSGSEITINADNSSGIANVSLILTSATNFLLRGEGAWNVLFSREGIGTASAQGSGSSGGIFHTGVNQ